MKLRWQLAIGGAVAVSLSGMALAEAIVSNTQEASWAFRGDVETKVIEEPTAPGGKLTRVNVTTAGKKYWDSAASGEPLQEIKKGQFVTFAFVARAVDSKVPVAVTANILQTEAPYNAALIAKVTVDKELGLYCLEGKAKFDLPAGGGRAVLHIAGQKQVFDLGPYIVTVRDKEKDPTAYTCRRSARTW